MSTAVLKGYSVERYENRWLLVNEVVSVKEFETDCLDFSFRQEQFENE